MDAFLNALKSHAGTLDQQTGRARFGLVTSVDPQNATARVTLQPEGVLSGWLPVLTPFVGAGWGLVCPPSPGDQVLIIAQEGDAEHGIIVGRAFSETMRPPQVASGEFCIVHKSGSFLKFMNDGTLQVKGDLHVDGDVYDRKGPLDRLRGHYNEHRHGSSAPPSPQD
jgi:phage baseplate assembly protein V